MKQLFLVWARYQRRPITMREHFGYELVFLPPIGHNKFSKALISYPIQSLRTIYAIFWHQPDVLWVQAPPNCILHVAWLVRRLRKKPLIIIADLHNKALNSLWFSMPLTRRILNSFDIVLVHNNVIKCAALDRGIAGERLQVLEDLTPNTIFSENPESTTKDTYFVMPCSFSDDEPVSTVIATARELLEYKFYFTGDLRRARGTGLLKSLPANVSFTGFLGQEAYDRLIRNSSGILCLTKRDGIQLSSAIEAIGASKPMIISDTPLLRSLFPKGKFVGYSVGDLRKACCEVANNYAPYARRSLIMQKDPIRLNRWHEQARLLNSALARFAGAEQDQGNT